MKMTDPPLQAFDSNGATDSSDASDGRDPVTGQFVKGFKGGPGRRKGARARWSEAFMADVEEAWKEMGPAAIRRALFTDPGGTIRGLIGILPKHAKLEVTNNLDDVSDDLLAIMIEQAERIAAAKAQPGDNAKPVTVIDLQPSPIGPPPPTSAEQRAEAQRRDMHDQHDALAAAAPALPSQALPHPVGRASPEAARTIERRNIAKLDDSGDVDPASLF
jgi:hypothetical protein